MKYSTYQKKIFKTVVNTDKNIIIDAAAGSGKSTTLFKIVELLPEENLLFLAFNKHIETYASKKLKAYTNIKVQTGNSYGAMCIRNSKYANTKFSVSKVWFTVDKVIGNFKLKGKIYNAVSVLRDFGFMGSNVTDLMAYISANPLILKQVRDSKVFTFANEILQVVNTLDKDMSCYDFNDQVRWPLMHSLYKHTPTPDVLLMDEVQDCNAYSIGALEWFHKKGVRIIVVGDKFQGIYGFRGSNGDALDIVQGITGAERMPLSITYRCKSTIVDYAVARFEAINDSETPPIEAYEEGGKVVSLIGVEESPYRLERVLKREIKFILSPKNKHLLEIWFSLLRDYGKSSSFKGSKITAMLTTLFNDLKKKIPFSNVGNELRVLLDHADVEIADNAGAALTFFSVRKYKDFDDVLSAIKELDKTNKDSIHLHTVHSAKGLEAEKVAVIDDFFYSDQTANMTYVAYTRASDYILNIKPFIPERKKVVKQSNPMDRLDD